MAILYALLSLAFAGVNDAVFKLYSSKRRPLGTFFIITGLVSAAFFTGRGLFRGALWLDAPTLLYGILAAAFSAVANVLLVFSMRETGAGIASTVYRLNLVLVALLAFLFLGEAFSAFKIAALVLAVGAVVVFSGADGTKPDSRRFLAVLLLACGLRAGMGFFYKVASNHHVCEDAFLALTGVAWISIGILVMLLEKSRRASGTAAATVPSGKARFAIPLVSGFLICGIILFMKLAVNTGEAGVVITITQFSFLITFPIAALAFGERVTPRKITGMALAACCIALMARA